MATPKNVLPVSWQAAHPVAMPTCFIAVPVNVVVEWQTSHEPFVGT